MYTAVAVSPNGDRAYVVYEAVTSAWAGSDISSPRPYHGVFMTAPASASGPGAWSAAYNGPLGDLRATFPGHVLWQERVGDYVYAAASRAYGIGTWIDTRNAAVCSPVQDWRGQSLAAGQPIIPPRGRSPTAPRRSGTATYGPPQPARVRDIRAMEDSVRGVAALAPAGRDGRAGGPRRTCARETRQRLGCHRVTGQRCATLSATWRWGRRA